MSPDDCTIETSSESDNDSGDLEESWFEEEGEEGGRTPWRQRSPLLSGVLIFVCLFLAWSWRDDLMYTVYSAPATDLGDAVGFTKTDLPDNVLVTIKAIRNPNRIAKMNAWFTDLYFSGVMGSDGVFIVTTPDDEKNLRPMEGLSNQWFTGRLRRMKDLGYYKKIREFSVLWFGDAPDPDAIVIEHGKTPAAYRWVWGVYLALFLVMALNVYKLIRRFGNR